MAPIPVELIGLGLAGVASGIGALWRRRVMRREGERLGRRAVLTDAGERLGLSTVEGEDDVSDGLAGRVDGFAVYVDIDPSGRTSDLVLGASVRVEHPAIPKDLTVLPRHDGPSREARTATGLGALEPLVKLTGEPLLLHALFDDAEKVEVLRAVAAHPLSIARGAVSREVLGVSLGRAGLVRVVEETLRVARLVCLARDAASARLAEVASRDPAPAMRRRALELLTAASVGSPRVAEACRRALEDEDEAVRFEGARHLGPEGLAVTREVAGSARAQPELRAAALEHLAALAPAEAAPIVVAALDARAPAVLAKALALLGSKHLGAIEDDGLEPKLIALVSHEDDALALAAIDVLARRGTAAAVAPLLELTKGLLRSRARAERAKGAVDWIQDRLGVVEHGALALVEPTDGAGQLSLAGSGGALSLPKEGGELALLEPGGRDPSSR